MQKAGKGMLALGWVLGLVFLTLFFGKWQEKQYNPNQKPSFSTQNGQSEVILLRNRYGHYVTSGYINGHEVNFIVDTGASEISIPLDIAQQLNLDPGPPQYRSTANGNITVYATRLDEVTIGNITQYDVYATINPYMKEGILLGMSFLKHLDFSQQGNQLILRARH